LRGTQELALVDLKRLVEQPDRGDGSLADADSADSFAFDEADRMTGRRKPCEGGGAHPPGCAATHDHDPILRSVGHGYSPPGDPGAN
jgi:hypothetical protein